MAQGVMADKGDKVVTPTTSTHNNESKPKTVIEPLNHFVAGAPSSSSCSCTKISTMQLFYEMKQKFPTVPDSVVVEFVEQNCHNRSACIDGLGVYPNSANVYPAALRNQQKKNRNQCANNNNQRKMNATEKKMQSMIADMTKETVNSIPKNENDIRLKPLNTLNLENLNCCTRPVSRPTRQAPPPPTTISSQHPQQNTLPNQPLNLSVNVIVSPVSRQSKPQSQSHSHYSFTLHQPASCNGNKTETPTTQFNNANHQNVPISTSQPTSTNDTNDVNGPSLRYTSSAYDAEIGYQSRLEIIVAGTNSNELDQQQTKTTENSISLRRLCETKMDNNLPSIVASSEFLEESMDFTHIF